MIRYALSCPHAHGFEGWFSSSEDFERQQSSGLVTCPVCNSAEIGKVLMAPSVATSRKKEETRTLVLEAAQQEAVRKLRQAVAEIRANADDVGERFAEEARRIHYGESEVRGIIGKATMDDAQALIEEGIEIAPLPVLPDDVN
nr:DUF1178 family protein [uncultured Gellertiella sp.]